MLKCENNLHTRLQCVYVMAQYYNPELLIEVYWYGEFQMLISSSTCILALSFDFFFSLCETRILILCTFEMKTSQMRESCYGNFSNS